MKLVTTFAYSEYYYCSGCSKRIKKTETDKILVGCKKDETSMRWFKCKKCGTHLRWRGKSFGPKSPSFNRIA